MEGDLPKKYEGYFDTLDWLIRFFHWMYFHPYFFSDRWFSELESRMAMKEGAMMKAVCILIERRSNGGLGKVAPYETREEAEAQRSVLKLQFPHSEFLLRDCNVIGGNKRRSTTSG